MWAIAGCCDDVQDLLTSVNDPDKHIRIVYVGHPDAMCWSSGCYVCECRVPLIERVRIGEARHVYSWGNQDGGNPNENACHVSSGNVCHVSSGGGVPTDTTQATASPEGDWTGVTFMSCKSPPASLESNSMLFELLERQKLEPREGKLIDRVHFRGFQSIELNEFSLLALCLVPNPLTLPILSCQSFN